MAFSLTCRRLLYRKQQIVLQQRSTGYIVLLPEVPKDQPENNALLRSEPLQEFSSITSEKCYNALVKRTLDFNSAFWKLEADIKAQKKPLTPKEMFDEYIHPLETAARPLDNTWAAVNTLFVTNEALLPKDQYRKIHYRALEARNDKFRSPLLHHSCKKALNDADEDLSEEQKRLLKKYTLEGKLNGMELSHSNYEVLHALLHELGRRRSFMQNKIDLQTRIFKYEVTDSNMVKNFPKDLLKAMAEGQDPEKGPWTVSLNPLVCKPFIEHCPDTLVRWNVWQANVSRCSTESTTKTSIDIEEIRDLRKRQAKLLGYKTFADMSMETKMAGSVDNVINMLDFLLEKARPAQARELESLNKFALQNGFHKTLDLWDVPYWKRQQQMAYHFDEDNLRKYFPLDTVLSGLFALTKQLFGVEIQERTGVDTWHKDVRFYDVFDNGSASPIAHFYLDPYARSGKITVGNNNGCTIGLRNRSTVGTLQLPQVVLAFNFPAPSHTTPSLLSFKDVTDLFGRFGHAIQTMLTRASYAEVSGLSNVEWDAVEVPTNFMVQWVYTKQVLESISGHYETGDKVPAEVLDNLGRMRKHMAGYSLCNDIYLSRFDLECYATETFWIDLMRKLWPMHFVFPLDRDDSHPCTFNDIFSHEWAAAYFSHLWARMIAADIFSAFEEVGLENSNQIEQIGRRYRDTFLSLSGSCHSAEIFRKFRGRDPSPDALLFWLGLQKPQKPSQSS